MIARATIGLVAALAFSSPALAARIVDYMVDDATLEKQADEQGLAPLAEAPVKGPFDVTLQMGANVDHEVIRGGIACSAWTVRNPVSKLLGRMVSAWDSDGALAADASPAALLIRIDRASTLSRCVMQSELGAVCITRVSLDGAVTMPGKELRPIHVEVERTSRSIGLCAGLTRGIGLISRDAVVKLIGEAGKS